MQQCVEIGENSLFGFLKNERRIVALTMVMCLCFLICTLAQRLFRYQLLKKGEAVLSQVGKPAQRPTAHWAFQEFDEVGPSLIRESGRLGYEEIALDLRPEGEKILRVLGIPRGVCRCSLRSGEMRLKSASGRNLELVFRLFSQRVVIFCGNSGGFL